MFAGTEPASDPSAPGAGSEPLAGPRVRRSEFLNAAHWSLIGRALKLSPRQLEISRCVVDGSDEVEIAVSLRISRHTVHVHLERLYRKLGCRNRCELVVRLFAAFVSEDGRR